MKFPSLLKFLETNAEDNLQFVGQWYETERSLEPFELGWDCSSFNYTHVSGNKFLVDMLGQKK